MLESWLQAPQSNFHNLVNSTKVTYPFCTTKEEALKYLNIIASWGDYYLTGSNYKIIDYERLIYLEDQFKTDEEVMLLITQIKKCISDEYQYKQKYLKRITNPIPREHFDRFYDHYLALHLDINPGKEQQENE